jgi:hypothetical protein
MIYAVVSDEGICCEASYSFFFLQIGHGIPSQLQLVANHWLLYTNVIVFFKLELLRDLQKMVMHLQWMYKNSFKHPFIQMPWNPKNVSISCYLEDICICFQKLHHSSILQNLI